MKSQISGGKVKKLSENAGECRKAGKWIRQIIHILRIRRIIYFGTSSKLAHKTKLLRLAQPSLAIFLVLVVKYSNAH